MSFRTDDLRHSILSLFADAQEPWHAILLWDVVKTCGCQKLRHAQLKADYAATHRKEHNDYLRGWYQDNRERITAKRRDRHANLSTEQRERVRELGRIAARRRRAEARKIAQL